VSAAALLPFPKGRRVQNGGPGARILAVQSRDESLLFSEKLKELERGPLELART